jgi:hypothetical protein
MKLLADDPYDDGRLVTRLLEAREEFESEDWAQFWPQQPYETRVIGGRFDGDRWHSENWREAMKLHRRMLVS